jgi:hypothetical protein
VIRYGLAALAAAIGCSDAPADDPEARAREARRAQQDELDRAVKEVEQRMAELDVADGKHWYDLPPRGLAGIPACQRYFLLAERYAACTQIPQAARDAARTTMESFRDYDVTLSDSLRQSFTDVCRQSIDALQQDASAVGCTIDVP